MLQPVYFGIFRSSMLICVFRKIFASIYVSAIRYVLYNWLLISNNSNDSYTPNAAASRLQHISVK